MRTLTIKNKDICDRLKAGRKKLNVSQRMVYDKIEIGRSLVSQYEVGTRIPTVDHAEQLAELYDDSDLVVLCKLARGNITELYGVGVSDILISIKKFKRDPNPYSCVGCAHIKKTKNQYRCTVKNTDTSFSNVRHLSKVFEGCKNKEIIHEKS